MPSCLHAHVYIWMDMLSMQACTYHFSLALHERDYKSCSDPDLLSIGYGNPVGDLQDSCRIVSRMPELWERLWVAARLLLLACVRTCMFACSLACAHACLLVCTRVCLLAWEKWVAIYGNLVCRQELIRPLRSIDNWGRCTPHPTYPL